MLVDWQMAQNNDSGRPLTPGEGPEGDDQPANGRKPRLDEMEDVRSSSVPIHRADNLHASVPGSVPGNHAMHLFT